MANVRILLATYNGSKYIREMIDSIIRQDYTDWELILSDDGSTDMTFQILETYAKSMPEKIVHYRSGVRFGNAQDHFLHLLKVFCDAPYIMFCDQDDVWHCDKITKTLSKMKEIEIDNYPSMVHTDLCVVDENLSVIDPSFMHYSKLSGSRLRTRQLLPHNVVTGCTMMINRALAKKAAEKIPCDGVYMHDWWLALLASTCGSTGFLPESTIEYRQHGKNSVGAKNVRSLKHIVNQLLTGQMNQNMKATFDHAEAFYTCFKDSIPSEKLNLIATYVNLGHKNAVVRRFGYIRHGFWKAGFLRNISQILIG